MFRNLRQIRYGRRGKRGPMSLRHDSLMPCAVAIAGVSQVCRLGRAREPVDRDALLPDYRREPDAVPPPPPK